MVTGASLFLLFDLIKGDIRAFLYWHHLGRPNRILGTSAIHWASIKVIIAPKQPYRDRICSWSGYRWSPVPSVCGKNAIWPRSDPRAVRLAGCWNKPASVSRQRCARLVKQHIVHETLPRSAFKDAISLSSSLDIWPEWLPQLWGDSIFAGPFLNNVTRSGRKTNSHFSARKKKCDLWPVNGWQLSFVFFLLIDFDSLHILPECNETTSPPNSSTDFDQSKLRVRKNP